MAVYSSYEMANKLGVGPSTLHKWSSAFSAWLTPSDVKIEPMGAAFDRSYTDDDLPVLQRAALLLRQGRSYARVRERLAIEFAGVEKERAVGETDDIVQDEPQPTITGAGDDQDEDPVVVDAEVIEPEPRVPPDLAPLLEQMAELYKNLLVNKDQEIAALRQALDATELAAATERRELEMLQKISHILERENQRLSAELEEVRQNGGYTRSPRRSWLSRLFNRGDEAAHSTS